MFHSLNGPPFFRASILLSSLFCFVLLLLLSGETGYGQCDQVPNFAAGPVAADSTIVSAYAVPSTEIYASYGFEMSYDSSFTFYRISDVELNGARVKLETWCPGKNLEGLSNASLSDSSTTIDFDVYTGDSLAFYRDLSWLHYTDSGMVQSLNYYRALDTLDYVVELVEASTGNRLVMLDSLGVLRNVSGTTPSIYGNNLIMAKVDYVVPSTLNGKTVFLRVLLYSRGSGTYYFNRTDRWGIGLKRRLVNPFYQAVANYIDTVVAKSVVDQTYFSEVSKGDQLRIAAQLGRVYEFEFDASPDAGTGLIVYDERGRQVFVPMLLPGSPLGLQQRVNVSFPNSGMFFVVLVKGSEVVEVEKVLVSK